MSLREAKNSMATPAFNTRNGERYSGTALSSFEPLWYAVYTNVNHEKQVAQQLGQRAIEHLLPLYDSVRRWKDRRVRLQMPLFPGYVFVRFALRDRLQVLRIPSIVRLVGFGGQPYPLPGTEIESLRTGIMSGLRIEPHPYLTVGSRVRIVRGPLAGAEGILAQKKNFCRVVLTLDLIARAAAVEVDATDIERIS
jgi:transcription antitermination factor NusG